MRFCFGIYRASANSPPPHTIWVGHKRTIQRKHQYFTLPLLRTLCAWIARKETHDGCTETHGMVVESIGDVDPECVTFVGKDLHTTRT